MLELQERSVESCGWRLRLRVYPSGFAQSRHAHDEPVINIVLSGLVSETARTGHLEIPALGVYLRPPGLEHSNRYGSGVTRVLTLTRFEGWRSAVPMELREISGADRLRAIVAILRTIHANRVDGQPLSGPLEKLFALLVGVRPQETSQRQAGIASARRALASGRAKVAEAAARVPMHRVALARSFRRVYGLSPREYRRWSRVRAAANRLSDGTADMSTIALESGFADQSHMCRDFRQLFGITPGEYRRLLV